MPVGTVKFFNASKGYGFIQQEGGGEDAFVHIIAVEKAGLRTLHENQRLSFDLEQGSRGKSAAVRAKLLDVAHQYDVLSTHSLERSDPRLRIPSTYSREGILFGSYSKALGATLPHLRVSRFDDFGRA